MIFLTPLILIHNFHTKGILHPKRSLVDIPSGCFVEAESKVEHIIKVPVFFSWPCSGEKKTDTFFSICLYVYH